MEFEKIVGMELNFYGVDNNEFKIGEIVYEAIEDPDDGWRSYLGSVEVTNSKGIFFNQPLAKVKILKVEDGSFDGYHLVDVKDDHVWLEVGTDTCDSWYPCFTFYYQPKEN